MNYTTPYEPPTLTVDLVAFQVVDDSLAVLLIKRPHEPFQGAWALPGGYNPKGETTQESLYRIVLQKAGVNTKVDLEYIEQLYTFDTVARDPRGHAVSVTYMGAGRNITPVGGSAEAVFYPIDKLPSLAYDHDRIIEYAVDRLRTSLMSSRAVAAFMPEKFSLSQLQKVYEIILDQTIDKRNFRKRILSLDLLSDTDEMMRDGAHRPAKLYQTRTIDQKRVILTKLFSSFTYSDGAVSVKYSKFASVIANKTLKTKEILGR